MRNKLLVLVALGAAAAGVWVWWLQGGFAGPVSDEAARGYFERIVAAAQAKDFVALCRLNGSPGVCRHELSVYCPESFGSGPVPQTPKGSELEQECREAVPSEPPTVVESRHQPSEDGYTGGRILLVKGVDGRGKAYETEVLVFRDKRSYKAVHAVFWSGDKFEEFSAPGGDLHVTPSSR